MTRAKGRWRPGLCVVPVLVLVSACAPQPRATDPLALGPAADQNASTDPAPGIGLHHGTPPLGGMQGAPGLVPDDGTNASGGAVSLGSGRL